MARRGGGSGGDDNLLESRSLTGRGRSSATLPFVFAVAAEVEAEAPDSETNADSLSPSRVAAKTHSQITPPRHAAPPPDFLQGRALILTA